MTYMPTGPGPDRPGPSGPNQRPGAGSGPKQPDADAENGLDRPLSLVAVGVGVLVLLLGFTTAVKSSSGYSSLNFFQSGNATPLVLLCAAGLIAGLRLLPKQAKFTGVAAAVAVAGFLCLVLQTIAFATSDGAGPAYGSYIEILLGLVLTAAVVGAMLIDAGIISPPAAQSGQQNGFGGGQGQYGQPAGGQYGQPSGGQYGQQAGPPYGALQPAQYGPGQYGAPQGSSDPSSGYGQGSSAPGQHGPGYYGTPEAPQTYGQQPPQPGYGQLPPEPSYGQPEQPSYGQAQQPSYGRSQQPEPQQPERQQPERQQPEQQQASPYGPPTQAFGSHAVEEETTVHPRDNPYGPPHQQ